ncbi:MAG: hypothetical protein GY855_00735, partial [candidate division Zixibacteria bacterium]|nr:hypothetical protein [candidate division Zixibacteria bacterium]
MVVIRYHGGSISPFYQWNRAGFTARKNFYNNSYTPHFGIDGIVDGGYNYGGWDNLITNRATVESPLVIELSGLWDDDTRLVSADLRVDVVDSIPFSDLRFFHGLTESDLYYDAPNGQDFFNQVFREFLSPNTGQSVSYQTGESYSYHTEFYVDPEYVPEDVEFFVFVQDFASGEILQATKGNITQLLAGKPDISIDMIPDNPPVTV